MSSSTKPISEKQQGQHGQANDPKRVGTNPVEPQKNERDDRSQSPKNQHDSQGDKPSR
jgi:hypothetical protein